MLKKIIFLLFFIIFILFTQNVNAQNKDEVAKKIEEYQKKLTELGKQRDTLSAEIQYMTLQISLAGFKIQETEETIITSFRDIKALVAWWRKRSISWFIIASLSI